MANYTFRTPVIYEGPIGQKRRLWYFFQQPRGITIVRQGSTYSQVRYQMEQTLQSYDEYWLGGRDHTVDEATKAALIAGGVGVTEENFTVQS